MKTTTFFKLGIGMASFLATCALQAQNVVSSTIQVKVTQAAVLNTADCDNITGDSDFAWHFIATDNSLGNSNNSPTDTDFMGDFNFGFRNGNNGPYTIAPNDGTADSGWDPGDGLFFNHFYCASEAPTTINIDWRGYENDATGDYSTTNSPDGNTGVQAVSINVPASSGNVSQTFMASGSSGSCPQNYSITFQVTRIDVLGDAPTDMTICQGDSVDWYGTFYSTAGSHDHVMTAQTGCDSVLTLNLTVNPTLTAGLTVTSNTGDTACVGEAVVLTAQPSNAGSNPSYQWFVDGMNTGVVGNAFGSTALGNGAVILCVMTVDTFCVADSTVNSNAIVMTIETCSGLSVVENQMWSIYPNPVQQFVTIDAAQMAPNTALRLYSATGQLLRETQTNAFPYLLQLNDLPSGFYLLQLANEKGIYTHKLTIDN